MPQLVANRERHFAFLFSKDHRDTIHLVFSLLNHVLHTCASILFIIASIFFLPDIHYLKVAQWLYVAGSIMFLLVGIIDFIETLAAAVSLRHTHHTRVFWLWFIVELLASICYLIGGICLTIGSFYIHEAEEITARVFGTWLAADVLYIIAICANMHQVWQAPSMWLMQLQSNVGAMFLVGKTLFLCGTIEHHITSTLAAERYGGYLYLAGSILFLTGSLVNAYRALVAWLYHQETEPRGTRKPGIPGVWGGWKPTGKLAGGDGRAVEPPGRSDLAPWGRTARDSPAEERPARRDAPERDCRREGGWDGDAGHPRRGDQRRRAPSDAAELADGRVAYSPMVVTHGRRTRAGYPGVWGNWKMDGREDQGDDERGGPGRARDERVDKGGTSRRGVGDVDDPRGEADHGHDAADDSHRGRQRRRWRPDFGLRRLLHRCSGLDAPYVNDFMYGGVGAHMHHNPGYDGMGGYGLCREGNACATLRKERKGKRDGWVTDDATILPFGMGGMGGGASGVFPFAPTFTAPAVVSVGTVGGMGGGSMLPPLPRLQAMMPSTTTAPFTSGGTGVSTPMFVSPMYGAPQVGGPFGRPGGASVAPFGIAP